MSGETYNRDKEDVGVSSGHREVKVVKIAGFTETCEYLNGVKDGLCEERLNGILRTSISYKNGKRNGPHLMYWRDGVTVAVAVNYIQDSPDGPEITYSENGEVYSRKIWKNGALNGLNEQFYKNGQLQFKYNMVNDKIEGLWVGYHPNGKISSITEYKAGKEFGLHERYDQDGELLASYDLRNGVYDGDQYEILAEEGIVIDRHWKKGIPVGLQEEWYYHQINPWLPKLKEFYLNGKLDGERFEWYPNGQIAYSGNFKEGKPHGIFEDFDEKGRLLQVRYYLNGERVAGRNYHEIIGEIITEGTKIEEKDIIPSLISKYIGR